MTPTSPTTVRSRVRLVAVALFLLLAGGVAGVLFSESLRDAFLRLRFAVAAPSEEEWKEQVRLDAVSLLPVIAPNGKMPETLPPEFWASWDPRRRLYSDERLADLRGRLEVYLDFLQAEYHDCNETWRTAPRTPLHSDAAKDLRAKLREDFGEFADTLLRQADELHDDAYLNSPRVVQGSDDDPGAVNYAERLRDLLAWLPSARNRVAELTAPLR